MKFSIDAQLPKLLAQWLRERGYDAIHTLYPFQLEMAYLFIFKSLFYKILQNRESDFANRKWYYLNHPGTLPSQICFYTRLKAKNEKAFVTLL